MDHISSVLDGLLVHAHLRQGVANYSFFSNWDKLVGKQLAGSTKPLRVQGGVLWVYVESSTLQHHLGFLIPQLLQRIREFAPQSRIDTIRFTLNPDKRS
jgi:predicted nucleic acid-binding Zn ribbon protein